MEYTRKQPREEEFRAMLEAARKLPGVAEVLAVLGNSAAAPLGADTPPTIPVVTTDATGTNQ